MYVISIRMQMPAGSEFHTEGAPTLKLWEAKVVLIVDPPITSRVAYPVPAQWLGEYSVSQKKYPPEVFWHFFPNGWEFVNNFLHTYYTFLSALDSKFLFIYL